MKRNISEISNRFIEWVRELVMNRGYVLLHCKYWVQTEQAGDMLLGYFDNNGVYLIPDKLFSISEEFLSQIKCKPIEIESALWLDRVIVSEFDGYKIRYRRQKRIGKSKKRYLTFKRNIFFDDDEQQKFIPYRI